MPSVQVTQALDLVDRLIPLVDQAEQKLRSARTWSFFDMLGGGFIVDMVKHYKLNGAASLMNEANALLLRLQEVLGSISIPADYQMTIGGFATFADFFFDGIFADAYMASKIFSSLEEVRRLQDRLYELRRRLQQL